MDFTCFLFAFIDRYYDGGSTVFTAQHYASVYASAVYAVIMRLSVYPSIFLSVCLYLCHKCLSCEFYKDG